MLCVPGLSPSPSCERRFANLMSRLGLRTRASLGHRIAQILNTLKKIYHPKAAATLITDVGVVTKNVPTRHTRKLHSLAPSLSEVCLRP